MSNENGTEQPTASDPAVGSRDLLGCPFCGGHAFIYLYLLLGRRAQCTTCGARTGPIQPDDEEAAKAWNLRHPNHCLDGKDSD